MIGTAFERYGAYEELMYPPGEVAEKLGIKSSTLRKWSVEFAPFLSTSARHAITMGGGASARRYTDHDVTVLERARALMIEYGTYDLARRALHDEFPRQVAPASQEDAPDTVGDSDEDDEDYALSTPRTSTEEMVLALKALRASLEHAYSEAIASRDAQIEALSVALDAQEQTLTVQQQQIADLQAALEQARQERATHQQHLSSLLVTLQRMARKAPTPAATPHPSPSPAPSEPSPQSPPRRWWHRLFAQPERPSPPPPEPSAPPPPPPTEPPPAPGNPGNNDDLLHSLLAQETGGQVEP